MPPAAARWGAWLTTLRRPCGCVWPRITHSRRSPGFSVDRRLMRSSLWSGSGRAFRRAAPLRDRRPSSRCDRDRRLLHRTIGVRRSLGDDRDRGEHRVGRPLRSATAALVRACALIPRGHELGMDVQGPGPRPARRSHRTPGGRRAARGGPDPRTARLIRDRASLRRSPKTVVWTSVPAGPHRRPRARRRAPTGRTSTPLS